MRKEVAFIAAPLVAGALVVASATVAQAASGSVTKPNSRKGIIYATGKFNGAERICGKIYKYYDSIGHWQPITMEGRPDQASYACKSFPHKASGGTEFRTKNPQKAGTYRARVEIYDWNDSSKVVYTSDSSKLTP